MPPPQFPFPVLLSSPVGEVSFRPGSPLAVSRISSANFLLSSPDRSDFPLSGFSLVHSGSNLLPPGVALPFEEFGSSSNVVPVFCDSGALGSVSRSQAPWLINHRWLPNSLR